MSADNVTGTSGAGSTEETQAASAKEGAGKPQGQPAAAMAAGGGNLNKLKDENPELWNKMMQTMGQEISNKWRKHPEKLKQIRRESERR